MTLTKVSIAISAIVILAALVACGTPETQVGKSAKTGASVGALAGLVFGGSLSDVAAGAAIGGLGGAAVGSVKAAEQEDAARTEIARQEAAANQRREDQRLAMEQEMQMRAAKQAEYEQRLREERAKLAAQQGSTASSDDNWLSDPEMLERAFGQDSVAGLYALRDCNHDKAIIAASAAENSTVASHQLASVWLRAMVAADLNRSVSANTAYRQLVTIDPDVRSTAEAKKYTAEAVEAVHADREALGLVCGA